MSTIAPGRLLHVDDSADAVAVLQTNMEILTEEIYTAQGTHQGGSPTTIIGPPTSGAHVEDEIWRDALGALWQCTAAGTPGDWVQARPAPVDGEPGSGTIPTGYLIRDAADNMVKYHAGSYVWRVPVKVVTSAQVLTSTQTVTITDEAEVYVLSNNIGTNDADAVITFNITGLAAAAGRPVMIHARAQKGITAGSRTSQVDLQINGSAIVAIPAGPDTAAATEDYSAMVAYNPLTGSWTIEQFGILPP